MDFLCFFFLVVDLFSNFKHILKLEFNHLILDTNRAVVLRINDIKTLSARVYFFVGPLVVRYVSGSPTLFAMRVSYVCSQLNSGGDEDDDPLRNGAHARAVVSVRWWKREPFTCIRVVCRASIIIFHECLRGPNGVYYVHCGLWLYLWKWMRLHKCHRMDGEHNKTTTTMDDDACCRLLRGQKQLKT